MNTLRILSIICLLLISTVSVRLQAQTGAKHLIGLDVRPGRVVPTNNFLVGDNERQHIIDQSLSFHVKYAFRFSKDSNLGRMFPNAYQGLGVSYNDFQSPAELGNPISVYASKVHLSSSYPVICHSITNGTSAHLSVGRIMIRKPIPAIW